MVEGRLAICILITMGFAVFIIWARTAMGQESLRQTLGEKHPRPKPPAQGSLTQNARASQAKKSRSAPTPGRKTSRGKTQSTTAKTNAAAPRVGSKPRAKPRS